MSGGDTADELSRTPPTLEDYLTLRSAGFVETAPASIGMWLAVTPPDR